MSLVRAIRRRSLPLPWVLLVALAVVNPYCCKYLPFFAADVLQTEENVEAEDELCPGKPKALRDEDSLVPPGVEPGFASGSPLAVPRSLAAAPEPRSRLAAGPSLPRHKVLGIYRV
jgi:hypothetical protein